MVFVFVKVTRRVILFFRRLSRIHDCGSSYLGSLELLSLALVATLFIGGCSQPVYGLDDSNGAVLCRCLWSGK